MRLGFAHFSPFVIGAIGVAISHFIALPLPFLLGPIFACLIAALCGMKMREIKPLNETMRTILGVAVGATLTPTVLALIPQMWVTLLFVPLIIIAIGLIGVPYFMRVWGFDFATAYYATMPGGLQDMMVFGQEAGANMRTLSLVHATRVLVIVVILPFILTTIWSADLSQPPGVPAQTIALEELGLMVFCALVGWQGAKAIGLFGASILGPLLLAMVFALLGLLTQRPPAEAIWAAQFFIGMTVGVKYVGITVHEMRKDLIAGLGFCFLLIVIAAIFIAIILAFGLSPDMETVLAFAPGGQAELTVLALIVGADVAFVAIHHVLRIFLVIIGAPLVARFNRPKSQD